MDEQLQQYNATLKSIHELDASVQQEQNNAIRVEATVSRSFDRCMEQVIDSKRQLSSLEVKQNELLWMARGYSITSKQELRIFADSLNVASRTLTDRRSQLQWQLHRFKKEHIDGIARYIEDLKGLIAKKSATHRKHIQEAVRTACASHTMQLQEQLALCQSAIILEDQGVEHFAGSFTAALTHQQR